MVRPALYFMISAGMLLILAPILLYSIQLWKERRIERIKGYSERFNHSAALRLERKAQEEHKAYADHVSEWRKTGTS
ncbi:hypothetical protein [Larsenimonas rhizosphaerae]|uniref:Uncharacterized protein n=1 Tax=Larsenimonas rhizosphaerae TaxID=2944682 RepID=A0AA42CWS5_9GAMM|nr:hypothetical protein [Larsenimonas rhizosphaerae]MCM2130279.1 hypothetical protein [Larsenimonas rhizosphaerae]MCX2522983.1 hypothetical protein [Larsenimonas rhizosphaerae]